jgi:hypothetical protein
MKICTLKFLDCYHGSKVEAKELMENSKEFEIKS